MGQGSSREKLKLRPEQLSQELAQRFASKSYSPLELYCFKAVFHSLADAESGIQYWSETSLCRFLELPDALGAGSIVYQMATYLGAFPLPSQAPAILTFDALLKAVTILTKRYDVVLQKRGAGIWLREVYRSLAIYDRDVHLSWEGSVGSEGQTSISGNQESNALGFAVDMPGDGDEGVEDEEDELILAALESMDVSEVFGYGQQLHVQHSIIPTDNLLKLVELMLLIAPIEAQQSLSTMAPTLSRERVDELRLCANIILSSFGVENHAGVTYGTFNAVVPATLPYMFDGLGPLFEHFLFAKDLDLSKRRPDSSSSKTEPKAPSKVIVDADSILREPGEILTLTVLSQLSFFLQGSHLFGRLRPLYSGNRHGFSMGSFEKHVFHWQAPTILLVQGRLLPSQPSRTRERAFYDGLPQKRYGNSVTDEASDQTLIYGAYMTSPWKHSGKACFGDSSTLLFQLSPAHDVFRTSSSNGDYAYFSKSPTHPAGVGFGTAVPGQSAAAYTASQALFHPGPVSLHLNDGLEFGIFTHLASGGGSFCPSSLPGRRQQNWQDRFEIECVEVWGCGGEDTAQAQRKAWAWEEREAEARRRVNLGTGDQETDRQLLMMAGIISHDRSGGSMG